MLARSKLIVDHVRRQGYARLNSQEFCLAIIENYFRESAATPETIAERNDDAEMLRTCIDGILAATRAAAPIKNELKRVLNDLKFCMQVQAPKRGPLPSKTISTEILSLVAGVVPEALLPRAADGSNLGVQGVPAGAVNFLKGDGSFEFNASFDAVFVAVGGSEVVDSKALFFSASDSFLGFGAPMKEPWPACLAALRVMQHPIEKGVPILEFLQLDPELQEDFRQRCAKARSGLLMRFSIRSEHDPLNISSEELVANPAMAKLLGVLCELVAPNEMMRERNAYDMIYVAPTTREPDGRAREDALYSLIHRHLKEQLKIPSAAETGEMLSFAGLWGPSGDDGSGECERFMERFITSHRQLAVLVAVRRLMEDALGEVDFASDDMVSVPGGHAKITWSDFHALGRWSDNLRGCLRLGLVDHGREQTGRFRLPSQFCWRWPAPHATDEPLERLIGPLVKAARKAIGAGRKPPSQ